MDIGIPRETRPREHRVALAPSGVKHARAAGPPRLGGDGRRRRAPATPTPTTSRRAPDRLQPPRGVRARARWWPRSSRRDPREFELLEPGQVVFAFWGLPAARPEDLRALLAREVTAVGLEAIEDDAGHAPVLTSMSEIAGSLAVIVGSRPAAERVRRQGHPPGRRAGRPARQLRDPRARGCSGAPPRARRSGSGAQVTLLDDSVDRLRGGRRRTGRRRDDDARDAAQHREGAVLRRPRARRGGRPRRARADARDPRHAAPDEAAQRRDGPRDRHGRLLRDLAPHVVPEPRPTRSTASCTSASRTCRRSRRAPRRWRSPTRCCRTSSTVADQGIERRAAQPPRARAAAPTSTAAAARASRWRGRSAPTGGACRRRGVAHGLDRELPGQGDDRRGGGAGDPLRRPRLDPRRLQQPGGAGAGDGGARRGAARRRGRRT